MMSYQVEFMPRAIEDISHLDKAIAKRILTKIKWLAENFDDLMPEVLAGDWQGLFKLRAGSYRVIYTANQVDRLINVHLIGHRRDIYRTK